MTNGDPQMTQLSIFREDVSYPNVLLEHQNNRIQNVVKFINPYLNSLFSENTVDKATKFARFII